MKIAGDVASFRRTAADAGASNCNIEFSELFQSELSNTLGVATDSITVINCTASEGLYTSIQYGVTDFDSTQARAIGERLQQCQTTQGSVGEYPIVEHSLHASNQGDTTSSSSDSSLVSLSLIVIAAAAVVGVVATTVYLKRMQNLEELGNDSVSDGNGSAEETEMSVCVVNQLAQSTDHGDVVAL